MFSSEVILVTQFFIDDRTMVNVPEEVLGFTATLRSRTSYTYSTSTLTTTASAQINGYTVTCIDVTMEIARSRTILLSDSSEFKNGNHDHNNIITNTYSLTFIFLSY